eukprot:scaffold23591_cov58-Phaeocystis_antarctica.AAC.1
MTVEEALAAASAEGISLEPSVTGHHSNPGPRLIPCSLNGYRWLIPCAHRALLGQRRGLPRGQGLDALEDAAVPGQREARRQECLPRQLRDGRGGRPVLCTHARRAGATLARAHAHAHVHAHVPCGMCMWTLHMHTALRTASY